MKSYHELLRKILAEGEPHADRTGVGTTSLFGAQLRHDMREGFPLVTTKRVPMRWVGVELEWFLRGLEDNAWLKERGVDIWDEWATAEKCAEHGRTAGHLGPTYGPMWRRYPMGRVDGDDIIERPNSRRLIVNAWHPFWSRRVTLPPCHTLFQVKCHGGSEMSLRMDARSIDAFLGLPFDLASYALLLELLCARVHRRARWLIIHFGDLHVYDTHRGAVDMLLSREPRKLPRVEVESVSDDLREFRYELLAYDPWPKIEAEVAV